MLILNKPRECTGLVILICGLFWLFWYSETPRQYYAIISSDSCLNELMKTFGIASKARLNVSEATYVRLAQPTHIGPACQALFKLPPRLPENFAEFKVQDPDQQAQMQAIAYQLVLNFTQRKLEIFICGGSLLGSVRHFGLFPWDTDVDFMIPSGQKAPARQLLIDMSAANAFRFVDTEATNQHWQLGILCQALPHKPPTRLYGTDRFYPVKSCKAHVDFFFGQVQGGYYKRLEYPYSFPVSDVYPLQLRPYGPHLVPAPKKAHQFLKAVYGRDYEIECKPKYLANPRVLGCDDLRSAYPFVRHLLLSKKHERPIHVDVLMNQSGLLSLFVPPQQF